MPDGPFPDGVPSGFQPGGGPWGRLPGAPNGAVPPARDRRSVSTPVSRSVWRRLMRWPAPLCVGTHATAPLPHRGSALVRAGHRRGDGGAARGGVDVSVPNAAGCRGFRVATGNVRPCAPSPPTPPSHPAVRPERPAPGPTRRCARPDCSATAAVTLVCDYTARTVVMSPASDAPEVDDPARYDLCARHASTGSARRTAGSSPSTPSSPARAGTLARHRSPGAGHVRVPGPGARAPRPRRLAIRPRDARLAVSDLPPPRRPRRPRSRRRPAPGRGSAGGSATRSGRSSSG